MKSSLRVWKRISINLIRIGVLLAAILVALGAIIGSPLYLGIKILALTEWYPLSVLGAFFTFWGAVYFSRGILRGSDEVNKALERLIT